MRSPLLAIAAALTAAACQGEPTSPRLAPEAPVLAVASSAVQSNIRIPINILQFVPCANGGAGEDVSLSGSLHILTMSNATGAGTFMVRTHAQPQGVSGYGLTTGDRYQGTGVTMTNSRLAAGETTTYVNNFRIVGQGKGNDFIFQERFHVTINALGAVTASRFSSRISCR